MRYARLTALTALCLAAASAGAAERTTYPLTLQNCGKPVTFDKAPERAVSIGQNTSEILLSLGLADKVAATAVWVGPVLPELEAANAKIARLSINQPSFEAVAKRDPDLVAAQFVFDVGPKGVVGRREQFEELGIATYLSPVDCAAKDNSIRDGARSQLFTMDLVYQEILELARIFDVQDRGEAMVARLKERQAKAAATVAGTKAGNVSLVYWFSSPDLKGDAWVAGRNGAPGFITGVLGARNVIETPEEWPAASWERIAVLNPTVIVLGTMDRRKFPADDPGAKVKFLETDPVTKEIEAVKRRRLVMMSAQSMNPTIRTIDGIEVLANGLREMKLVD